MKEFSIYTQPPQMKGIKNMSFMDYVLTQVVTAYYCATIKIEVD